MKQLYDQIDENGIVVIQGMILVPGLTLPTGHEWVIHTEPIESIKEARRGYIEDKRNSACFSPVNYNGYTWQADIRSQSLLTSAITMVSLGVSTVPPTWRTLDNQDISVTIDYLKGIAGAIAQETLDAYTKSWLLKSLVDSATTSNEVRSIYW